MPPLVDYEGELLRAHRVNGNGHDGIGLLRMVVSAVGTIGKPELVLDEGDPFVLDQFATLHDASALIGVAGQGRFIGRPMPASIREMQMFLQKCL